MPRPTYTQLVMSSAPRWLRRTEGYRLLYALGAVLDTQVTRNRDAIALRFPRPGGDTSALNLIGTERGLARGPQETDATYRARIQPWIDVTKRKGNAFALLEQLGAYLAGWLDVRADLVSQLGIRHVKAADGSITKDSVDYEGTGDPDAWAHMWLFFWLYDEALPGSGLDTLLDESGDPILDESGDPITTPSVSLDTVPVWASSGRNAEILATIPREWIAGHTPYVTIVLLYRAASGQALRLWGYPPGELWDDSTTDLWLDESPVIITTGGA